MSTKKAAKKAPAKKAAAKKAPAVEAAKKPARDVFALQTAEPKRLRAEAKVHKFASGKTLIVCSTDKIVPPKKESMLELVVDSSEGFIPLWEKGTFLRWRFNEASMSHFEDPASAKAGIRELLGEAILQWGDAAPVRFSENSNAWDFQIVMSPAANCSIQGCTLASAFFPDTGRHDLMIYPTMFEQTRKEQVDTMVHELGHVFGLRHFFAKQKESTFPSEVFGTHEKFTIMNYGEDSELTEADKLDLKTLYQEVWSGKRTEINGTKIVQVSPYHTLGNP